MKITNFLIRLTFLSFLLVANATTVSIAQSAIPDLGDNASLHGKQFFPTNNPWNQKVDTAPVDPNSGAIIARFSSAHIHPDFGANWNGGPFGIPYRVVSGNQAKVNIGPVLYDDESDPGPYPVPANAPIEGGANSSGDRHVLILDRDNDVLYELYNAFPSSDGSWRADAAAKFDLKSNSLRPEGWTSADAAGLPILPGLVRYDEVFETKSINHAIRFTLQQTKKAFVHPATHFASSLTDSTYPPMGARFRLKADFNIEQYSAPVKVILQAMKTYGLILADNGSNMYISGAPDARWSDSQLGELKGIPATAFEMVQLGFASEPGDSTQPPQNVPKISSFKATPDSITLGRSSTLSWAVTGAVTISVDQGVGAVNGPDKSVSPMVTTTYTLTATNPVGSSTAKATITVVKEEPPVSLECSQPKILCVDDTAGENQEYATLQAAANAAQAGDTVLVADGNYAGFFSVNSGTAAAAIVFKANGKEVVINSRNQNTLDNINIEGDDYIVIDGFIVKDGKRAGIRVVNATGVVVKNNLVGPNATWGIFSGFSPKIEVSNNKTFGSVQEHGIYLSNSNAANDNFIVRGNESYENKMNGIQLNGDCHMGGDGEISGSLIEKNTVHDNGFKGFSIISAPGSVIQNNVIYNNGLNGGAGGIHLTDEPGCGKPSSNTVVVNNTIVEPRIAGIRITDGVGNSVIFNNLVVGARTIVDEVGGNNIDAASNLQKPASTGLFVNAAANDFHLASGSAAINLGRTSYSSKQISATDFEGDARTSGSAPDAGADEAAGGSNGPTPIFPVINSFSSSPTTITAGTSATLSWDVTGATSLVIDQGVGNVSGTARAVSPAKTTTYTLTATNDAGTVKKTITVTVAAASDRSNPSVLITSPAAQQPVSGTVKLTASATDDVKVAGVQFKADGSNIGIEDTVFPYEALLNTETLSNAVHHLSAIARDTSGNFSMPSEIAVTVNNSTIPSPIDPVYLYQEAEKGQVTSPMQIVKKSFVRSRRANRGTVTMTVDIPKDGDYIVWGNVMSPNGEMDSFFVSLDNDKETIYDTSPDSWSNEWQWTRVIRRGDKTPRVFSLKAGSHAVKFRGREPYTFLNKILVTNDLNFIPK